MKFGKYTYTFFMLVIVLNLVQCRQSDSHERVSSEFCSIKKSFEAGVTTITDYDAAEEYMAKLEKLNSDAQDLLKRARLIAKPSTEEIYKFNVKSNLTKSLINGMLQDYIDEAHLETLPPQEALRIKQLLTRDPGDYASKITTVLELIESIYVDKQRGDFQPQNPASQDQNIGTESVMADSYDQMSERYSGGLMQKNGGLMIINNGQKKYDFYIHKDGTWAKNEIVSEIDKIGAVDSLIQLLMENTEDDDPYSRWTHMEFYLPQDNNIIPNLGFYYANVVYEGGRNVGLNISRPTICIFTSGEDFIVLNGEVNEKKSNEIYYELKKATDNLMSADVINFRNCVPRSFKTYRSFREMPRLMQEQLNTNSQLSKVVEWFVTVNNVKKEGEIYLITTRGTDAEKKIKIQLIARSDNDHKLVESLKPGDKIKVRGKVAFNSTLEEIYLQPAVLVDEPGTAKSDLLNISNLLEKKSSDAIPLESITDEITADMTSLQVEKFIKKHCGKTVTFQLIKLEPHLLDTFDIYLRELAKNRFKLTEYTSYFKYSYDNIQFVAVNEQQRPTISSSIGASILCRNDSDRTILRHALGDADRNPNHKLIEDTLLCGKIIEISKRKDDTFYIYIDPCILVDNVTSEEAKIVSKHHDSEGKLEDGSKTSNPPNTQQSDEEEQGVMNRDSDPAENTNTENTIEDANIKELPAISEPTAAEKTLFQALVGEWRLESRSYNENISFISDGTYISTLEYMRGPPAGTTAEFNGTWKVEKDELIQMRSGKISKTKIRMISTTSFEEPTEDRNWPRIYSKVMEPKTSSDDSSLKQQRELESFLTTITQNDTVNSKGIPIMDPVLILMQDRANTHRFGNPDSDQVDQFFKLPTNRANIRSFLERGSFPRDIQKSILSTSGLKLKIRIHSNNEGKICVDVSYANAQGNSSSNFSEKQKMMSFIDSESNFREEPSVNSAVKFQPRKGTTGRVLEHRGKWIKIQLENGDTGWAHDSNLKKVFLD